MGEHGRHGFPDHGGVALGERRPVGGVRRGAWRALLAAALACLCLGAGSGCERGCTRDVSLAVKQAADEYLQVTHDLRAAAVTAKRPPFQPALIKLRGLFGSGDAIDWRLMTMQERQLALSGLIGVERGEMEERMLRVLLDQSGVDPFVPDPLGMTPFAAAMAVDARVANRMVRQLATHPRTRPSNAVLCGLRAHATAGARATLRPYCACVADP